MTEGRSELEAGLAEIDRKLRDLQRELQAVTARPEPAPPEPAPPPPPPPPPPEPAPRSRLLDDTAERVSELSRRIDELQRLGEELEEATRALQEEFARSGGATAAAPTWSTTAPAANAVAADQWMACARYRAYASTTNPIVNARPKKKNTSVPAWWVNR